MIDYPFDTTRAAGQMVLNGVMDRHTRMKVILSHAGDFLPYASHRFAELASDVPPVDHLRAAFKRFYFDTALSSGPAALPSLHAIAGTNRILYGSDFPYAPASVGAPFTSKVDAYEGFGTAEQDAVNRGNALRLFARLQP